MPEFAVEVWSGLRSAIKAEAEDQSSAPLWIFTIYDSAFKTIQDNIQINQITNINSRRL